MSSKAFTQAAGDVMDENLKRWLEDFHAGVDGKEMMKELLKYRQEVIAKRAGTTPLLRHAFQVLQDWHLANAGDPTPWQYIKDNTKYIPPRSSSPTIHHTPHPASPFTNHQVAVAGPLTAGIVTPTPVAPPPPSNSGVSVPSPSSRSLPQEALGVLAPAATKKPTAPVPAAIHFPAAGGDSSFPSPLSTVPMPNTGSSVTDMTLDGGDKGNPIGKVNGKSAKRPPKQSKPRQTSRLVPGHHLESEAEPTPPPPKKQKTSTAMARTTATGACPIPDKLWPDLIQRPTLMCDTCEGRGLPICVTAGLQIACLSCHAGKIKCSYSALRAARLDEMLDAGELAAAKGGKKAASKKKVQDVEGSEMVGGKATGKRKRQSESASPGDGVPDDIAASGSTKVTTTAPSPLANNTATTPPPGSTTDAAIAIAVAHPQATTTNPTAALPMARIGRGPTVGGLQRELNDLRTQMATMQSNQEQLLTENVMLHGWCEVLMALKDQMLVTVPALQAEVRGLSNGVALEKMKQEMTVLQSQLRATNSRLARVKDSSSSDDDEDEESALASAQPLVINTPKSSMFVHPSQLRQSIRMTSPAASGSGLSLTGGTSIAPLGDASTTEPSTCAVGTMIPMADNVASGAPAAT